MAHGINNPGSFSQNASFVPTQREHELIGYTLTKFYEALHDVAVPYMTGIVINIVEIYDSLKDLPVDDRFKAVRVFGDLRARNPFASTEEIIAAVKKIMKGEIPYEFEAKHIQSGERPSQGNSGEGDGMRQEGVLGGERAPEQGGPDRFNPEGVRSNQ